MLSPASPPPRYRRLITDKGNTLCFDKGRHRVVDGVEIEARPGDLVAHASRLLVIGRAQLRAEGPMRIAAAQRARLVVRGPDVTALDRAHVVIHAGDLHARMRSTFRARGNAQVYLAEAASGVAEDESHVEFLEGATGEVIVRSERVRILWPRRQCVQYFETEKGLYGVRLVPAPL